MVTDGNRSSGPKHLHILGSHRSMVRIIKMVKSESNKRFCENKNRKENNSRFCRSLVVYVAGAHFLYSITSIAIG